MWTIISASGAISFVPVVKRFPAINANTSIFVVVLANYSAIFAGWRIAFEPVVDGGRASGAYAII